MRTFRPHLLQHDIELLLVVDHEQNLANILSQIHPLNIRRYGLLILGFPKKYKNERHNYKRNDSVKLSIKLNINHEAIKANNNLLFVLHVKDTSGSLH